MKSIEELARELVNRLEVEKIELMDWSEFNALKSALDTPPALPPAEEWPQWYRFPQGDLFKFDGPGELGARWSSDFQHWGSHGKAYGLNEIQLYLGAVLIPAAEALAIIERAKK